MEPIQQMSDDYTKTQMVAIGITFIVVPVLAVILRIWAKLLCRRGIMNDDYLAVAAMICAVGCACAQLTAAFAGQLGQHQTDDAQGMPILDDPKFIIYEKCKLTVNILSTVGLGFVKSSFLLFFMNIFVGRRFKFVAMCTLALVVSWTIAFFFANLFTCYPITALIEPFYQNKCVDGLKLWYSMAVTDVIMDFMVIFLPVPMVLRLQLRPLQRAGVLMLFLLGATVIAFSIVRLLVYIHVGDSLQLHYADETYYTSPVFFWACIELSSAVLCSALPTYRPIWLKLRGRPLKSTGAGSSNYKSTRPQTDPLNKINNMLPLDSRGEGTQSTVNSSKPDLSSLEEGTIRVEHGVFLDVEQKDDFVGEGYTHGKP